MSDPESISLQNTLADIIDRLRQGQFQNEQAVSQGIVLRILRELGWPAFDTTLVWPEYRTGGGRADFALCHPPSKPAALIEVKLLDKAEDGVEQALLYGFQTGVPLVILTDGRTWRFYLPAERGSYEDRRVYNLDIFERTSAEAAEILTRYIARARIQSGEALEAARREYHSRTRRSESRAAIPEAWRELVEKCNESLVGVVASAVESKAGTRPDVDDVAGFLASLKVDRSLVAETVAPRQAAKPALPPRGSHRRGDSARVRAGTLTLCGKTYKHESAQEAMVIVLRELAKRDPTFLEHCARHPDVQGSKRRYIARAAGEIYPGRKDLQEKCRPLPGGWLVATNLNAGGIKKIIKLAAEVAGLTFGKDVILEF